MRPYMYIKLNITKAFYVNGTIKPTWIDQSSSSFFCVQKFGSNGQRASDDKNNEHAREDAISIRDGRMNVKLL